MVKTFTRKIAIYVFNFRSITTINLLPVIRFEVILILFLSIGFQTSAANKSFFAPVAPVDINTKGNTVTEKALNGTQVGITAYSSGANLALNRPITTSGNLNTTNVAANAVDGSTSTRWESPYSDPQWIYVDLGASYNINEVKITWEAAYAKNYQIQVSDNATDWTDMKVITNNSSTANDYTGSLGTGRYVRIYGTVRATSFGYSIYELEVYGNSANSTSAATITYSLTNNAGGRFAIDAQTGNVTVLNGSLLNYSTNTSHTITVQASDGSTTSSATFTIYILKAPVPIDNNASTNTIAEGALNGATVGITAYLAVSNIALNQPATALSLENSNLPANYAFDGNTSTRWASAYSDPNWIYVDLGGSYNINEVKISWEAAYGKNFSIQVSDDAATWTDAKVVTGNTATVNDFTGLTATGRYVRMYGTARGTGYGYSIYEFEVYGTQATGATGVTYSLSDNAGGRFAINATTGIITLANTSLINYQKNTSHNVTVVASTGYASYSATFTIAVTSTNKAPIINSDGGPANGTIYVASGTTAVTTVTATDPEANTITYSKSGADAAKFSINSTTGSLAFASAPNSASPASTLGTNNYTVIVTATDNGSPVQSSTQTLTVVVTSGAYDWVGATATGGVYYWSTASNWNVNGTAASTPPGATNIARIGITGYTTGNEPTVTASTSVGTIQFGVNNTPVLTVNSGQTLTVNGAVLINHNTTTTTAKTNTITLQGAGALNVANLQLGLASQIPASALSGAATTFVSSKIAQLIINNNIALASVGNGSSGYCYPNFQIDANVVKLYGSMIITNQGTISSLPSSDPYRARFSLGSPVTSSTATSSLYLYSSQPVSLPLMPNFGFTINGNGTNNVYYAATSGNQIVFSSADGLVATTNTYGSLNFLGAAAKIVNAGSIKVATTWSSSGGSVNLSANNPVITLAGDWNNDAVTNLGSGDLTVGGALINSGTLTLGSGNLNITSNYSNSGTFTAGTGAVNFNGAAQSLADNGNGTVFSTVNFTGGGTKTLLAGYFAVNNVGLLTMGASTNLKTNGLLTLKSAYNGTATVATIPATAGIVDNVNAEIFITGSYGRGYRLVSSPVNTSTGFFTIANLLYSTPVTGPNPGAGSFDASNTNNSSAWIYREGDPFPNNNVIKDSDYKGIYSPAENIPVGTGVLFFNRGNRSANLSAKLIGPSFPTPEDNAIVWLGALNQGNITIKVPQNNIGNFIGSSTYAKESPGSSTPTGYYYKYNSTYAPVSNMQRTNWYGNTNNAADQNTDGFNLIGNPYPSAVDLDAVTFGTDLNAKVYVYNPQNKQFSYYQKGSSGSVTDGNGATRFLASGQGFFVRSNVVSSTNAAVTFAESNKVTSANVPSTNRVLLNLPKFDASFNHIKTQGTGTTATLPTAAMMLRLQVDSSNYDGAGIYFNSAFAAIADDLDAADLDGMAPSTYFSSYSADNKKLAINMMPNIYDKMRIHLFVSTLANSSAQLMLKESTNIFPGNQVWLIDHYKKDSIQLNEASPYRFNINRADTASFGAKRFELVFHVNESNKYKLLTFTGKPDGQQVILNWTTENDHNTLNFIVERSEDGGKTYAKITTIQADDTGVYTFTDTQTPTGNLTYRLEQDDDKLIAYSNLLNFQIAAVKEAKTFFVYPNPAVSVIEIQSSETLPARFEVRISNTAGVPVLVVEDDTKLNIGNLTPGFYILEARDSNTRKRIGVTKFIKN